MYKQIENPLPPTFGRMYVDKATAKLDTGPPRENDIVTVGVDDDIEFYVLVQAVEGDSVKGEILAIGPNPRESFKEWECSDLVQFEEPAVRAIIRDN